MCLGEMRIRKMWNERFRFTLDFTIQEGSVRKRTQKIENYNFENGQNNFRGLLKKISE